MNYINDGPVYPLLKEASELLFLVFSELEQILPGSSLSVRNLLEQNGLSECTHVV